MSDTRPLIVHIVFRFDFGGLENGVVNLVNGSRNDRFRHAVIALTEATDFRRRLHDDVPVYTLGKRPGKDPAAYWRLYRLLRRLKPSAVHTRNFGTLDCAFIAFLARVPVRIHGEHGWDIFDPDGRKSKYRIVRQVLARFIQVFVTVSDDLRRWLVTVVGIPPEKVARICNGVDTKRFRPRDGAEACLLPPALRDGGSVILGSVTRFSPIKDPLNLVEAFIRLREVSSPPLPPIRLLMIGDGELHGRALQRLEETGAASAAWLPGARNDVAELLRAMDIFVLGSLREGISNTILEAMASGLPVIATDTGGNVEIVAAGETGALVPPGRPAALAAAVIEYLRNPALIARHGRQARDRAVAQYSIDAMLTNYRELYDHNVAIAGT